MNWISCIAGGFFTNWATRKTHVKIVSSNLSSPSCWCHWIMKYFFVVQLLSHFWFFAAPWTAAHQGSLSFTIFQSLLKLVSIESVMSSNHLTLCHPLLLPSIFPSIRMKCWTLFIPWGLSLSSTGRPCPHKAVPRFSLHRRPLSTIPTLLSQVSFHFKFLSAICSTFHHVPSPPCLNQNLTFLKKILKPCSTYLSLKLILLILICSTCYRGKAIGLNVLSLAFSMWRPSRFCPKEHLKALIPTYWNQTAWHLFPPIDFLSSWRCPLKVHAIP